MGDGVEFGALRRVGEDDAGELGAIETPIGEEHVRSERRRDLLQGGLAGLDHLARQLIGVDHLRPEPGKHLRHHRLAGSDPAGKA